MQPLAIRNGEPTKPAVNKLMVLARRMNEEDVITHEALEEVIGRRRKEARYRTVLNAFLTAVRNDLGVALIAVRGRGYMYPTAMNQAKYGVEKITKGIKATRTGTKCITIIDPKRFENDRQREACDYIVMRSNYMFEMCKAERKVMQLTIGKPDVNPSMAADTMRLAGVS